DGNNVAHSLILTAATAGAKIRVATPKGYEPDAQIVDDARGVAAETGAGITLMNNPHEAVADVDAIYTDAWTSMGWENEAEQRSKVFVPYQVNEALMAEA